MKPQTFVNNLDYVSFAKGRAKPMTDAKYTQLSESDRTETSRADGLCIQSGMKSNSLITDGAKMETLL
jgi:hypothetical protein